MSSNEVILIRRKKINALVRKKSYTYPYIHPKLFTCQNVFLHVCCNRIVRSFIFILLVFNTLCVCSDFFFNCFYRRVHIKRWIIRSVTFILNLNLNFYASTTNYLNYLESKFKFIKFLVTLLSNSTLLCNLPIKNVCALVEGGKKICMNLLGSSLSGANSIDLKRKFSEVIALELWSMYI